jgi:chromosome segregation ATPase
MTDDDLTVRILTDIRDGVRQTNVRLDETIDRLDTTIDRLEGLDRRVEGLDRRVEGLGVRVDRLEKRQTRNHIELFTEVAAIRGTLRELHEATVDNARMRHDIAEHERRITALEERER